MRAKPKIGKELIGLILLFLVFLAFAAYYETAGQERVAYDTPSSANAKKSGVRALLLLVQELGYNADQLKADWQTLRPEDKALIIVEPLDKDRGVPPEEMNALTKWVKEGGTLLYFVAEPSPLDPAEPLMGDVAAIKVPEKESVLEPKNPASPIVRDIPQITVRSAVRLDPAKKAKYETLFADKRGAVVIRKTFGKGRAYFLADAQSVANGSIRQSGVAQLSLNIIAEAVGATKGVVLFDEYHHGIGFESAAGEAGDDKLLALASPAQRLILWHGFGLFLLLLWNGNMRFGRPLARPVSTYRPTADYVGSMARLYRKAGASDIALLTLYNAFRRDLTSRLDLTADADQMTIAQRAAKTFPAQPDALRAILAQGEAVRGGQRLNQAESFAVIQQIEQFRRTCDLV